MKRVVEEERGKVVLRRHLHHVACTVASVDTMQGVKSTLDSLQDKESLQFLIYPSLQFLSSATCYQVGRESLLHLQ